MRINKGKEFVIAGYTLGGATFDALVFGYYEGSKLLYVSRTRNGFTPRLREDLLKRFRGLEITECPFANLPKAGSGALGARTHGSKDGRMPVDKAGAGGAVRVHRMDARQSLEAFSLRRAPGG
jgi:ATP-dependent DNA ligase